MPQSRMFQVFEVLDEIIATRRRAGQPHTDHDAAVAALLEYPAIARLAEEASCQNRFYDTPGKWLANQYDFYSGRWWRKTPYHRNGLAKFRQTDLWVIDATDLDAVDDGADHVAEIAALVVWFADAVSSGETVATAPVDAAMMTAIAPGTWGLFVDKACAEELRSATTASFLAWSGEYLKQVSLAVN